MYDWLAGGRAADVVLALMALEAVVLVGYNRRSGRGLAPRELLPGLAAGALLVLALRATLAGQGVAGATPWLLGALVAHLSDLALRWRR
ncbi:MAG: hypothetical protein U1F09_12570 [Steroidobacteraceae bacterium]